MDSTAPGRTREPVSPALDRVRRYAFAALATAAGWGVTALSAKVMRAPFFTFQLAAVVLAALYGGIGPGTLVAVVSVVGFSALYFGPSLESPELVRMAAFLAVSLLVAWVAAKVRRARHEAEAARARAEAAELEARTVGAHQERLVAVVSHDLRSPLGAIALSAEALRTAPPGSELQARAIERIAAGARRMDSMIRDLLDFARARHHSGLPVRPELGRLAEIARHVVDEVRAASPGAGIELEVEGDDLAPLDPARVEQVVANLVSNALKHAAPGTAVRVRVARAAARVRLEVSNRGAPIAPQLLPTLFEPFRAGDAPGSVGLGLFIVREIARGHGGAVSASSDERGTVVTVDFPAAAGATALRRGLG